MSSILIYAVTLVSGFLALQYLSQLRSGLAQRAAQALICAVTAAVVFAISPPPEPFEDFRGSYYPAGKSVVDDSVPLPVIGTNPEVDGFGFVNLPILAYVFAPLGALPELPAALVFTAVGIATTIAAWLLLVRLAGVEGNVKWLFLFLIAVNGPLHNSIREGNSTQIVLLMVAGGLYLLRAQRLIAAGIVVGAAALIKLPLLLFGAYFVLCRNWRATFGFVGVCASSVLISLAVFGVETHQRWLDNGVLQYSRHPVGAWYVQSIAAFVIRLFEGSDVLHVFHTTESPPTVQRLSITALVFCLYLVTLWACTRPTSAAASTRKDLEYLLVLCLAIVTTPLSWPHYYALLLVPFAFFLGRAVPIAREARSRHVAWFGIICTLPVVSILYAPTSAMRELYTRVGISHFLFGGMIWFGLLAWERSRLTRSTQPSVSGTSRSSRAARLLRRDHALE